MNSNLNCVSEFPFFFTLVVWSAPGGSDGSYDVLNPHYQQMKNLQGRMEQDMVLSMAGNKMTPKDAHAIIKGAIDDLQIVQTVGQNSDEDDLLGGGHSALDGIDFSSFIVQRLSKKTNSTNYYAFEDTPDSKPLFMRSTEDYGVDFIIFMNPAFPKGTGHYIVLRRLESHTDLMNYAADEEVELQEDFQDKNYDFDDEDNEEEDDERLGGGYEDLLADPRRQYQGNQRSSSSQRTNDEIPGVKQSGEENYQNTAGADEEKEPQLVSPYNETLVLGRSLPKGGQTWKQKLAQQKQDENDGEVREIIYESFVVIFKGSIHGFISNIDPLQFSFQAEGDPTRVLNESGEDADIGENDNIEGEDDDDDDSYNYALNEASPDLFEVKQRKKRSVESDKESAKDVRLKQCYRRVQLESINSWRTLELSVLNE